MHVCSFHPHILKPTMRLVVLGPVSTLLFQGSWSAKEDGILASRVLSEREVQLGHLESMGISEGTQEHCLCCHSRPLHPGCLSAQPGPISHHVWPHCVRRSVTIVSQSRPDAITDSIDPIAGLLVPLEARYRD